MSGPIPVRERRTSDLIMRLAGHMSGSGRDYLSAHERHAICAELDKRSPPLPGSTARAVLDDDQRRYREEPMRVLGRVYDPSEDGDE